MKKGQICFELFKELEIMSLYESIMWPYLKYFTSFQLHLKKVNIDIQKMSNQNVLETLNNSSIRKNMICNSDDVLQIVLA